jgi:hypothetical protein
MSFEYIYVSFQSCKALFETPCTLLRQGARLKPSLGKRKDLKLSSASCFQMLEVVFRPGRADDNSVSGNQHAVSRKLCGTACLQAAVLLRCYPADIALKRPPCRKPRHVNTEWQEGAVREVAAATESSITPSARPLPSHRTGACKRRAAEGGDEPRRIANMAPILRYHLCKQICFSYARNTPWRPIRLSDIEDLTLFTKSAHRWR